MRKLKFISLLLLLPLLLQEAAGIHLVPERAPKATGDSILVCKGTDIDRCLQSGRIRKLVTKPTTSKYDKNDHENGNGRQAGHFINDKTTGDKVETFPVPLTTNQHLHHHRLEHFPDVFDIAGMDYSPPRRKPSIHN